MPADGGAVDSNPARRLLAAVPGPAIMLAVACLWGTNPIALRYLYRGEGGLLKSISLGVLSFHNLSVDTTSGGAVPLLNTRACN